MNIALRPFLHNHGYIATKGRPKSGLCPTLIEKLQGFLIVHSTVESTAHSIPLNSFEHCICKHQHDRDLNSGRAVWAHRSTYWKEIYICYFNLSLTYTPIRYISFYLHVTMVTVANRLDIFMHACMQYWNLEEQNLRRIQYKSFPNFRSIRLLKQN